MMPYFNEKLRLLDFTADYFKSCDLSESYLIACQHIVPSTHRMLLKLMDLGLRKERISLIGKCYSTSSLVYDGLRNAGFYVHPTSKHYDSHEKFDERFQKDLLAFLKGEIKRLKLNKNSRILLLDDGGELLKIANQELWGFLNVHGVEQTSSGYNKLKQTVFPFPIVNVARSRCKLEIETPMIVASQMRLIGKSLRDAPRESKVLILGNGYIGKALFNRLEGRFQEVDRFDPFQIGEETRRQVVLGRYDVIIGTSGATSIPAALHPQLKRGTVLISASSSDREFDAVYLRRKAAQNADCHRHLTVEGVHLINSGFPVNFYGSDFDNVPLGDIQLTFALLLAGLCQTSANGKGFTELDREFQNRFISYLGFDVKTQNPEAVIIPIKFL